MRKRHPEVFTPLAEKALVTPNVVIVFAQWANTGGAAQEYDDSAAAWFHRIRAAADGVDITGIPILNFALVVPYIDNQHPTALSKLSKCWVLQKIREYELPFVKSAYSSMEPAAPAPAFSATLTTGLIDEVQSNLTGTECKISLQFQALGATSQTRANSGNGTAYQWRDVNLTFLADIWYGPSPRARRFAEDWAQRARTAFVGEQGLLTKRDIRFFAYPHGNTALTEVWPCYYEARETYECLLAFKKKMDPCQVFSANGFCLGGAKTT